MQVLTRKLWNVVSWNILVGVLNAILKTSLTSEFAFKILETQGVLTCFVVFIILT